MVVSIPSAGGDLMIRRSENGPRDDTRRRPVPRCRLLDQSAAPKRAPEAFGVTSLFWLSSSATPPSAVMSETTRRRSRGCSPLRMTGTILSLVGMRANYCMITLLSGHKRVGTSLLSRDTVAASTRARCVPRRARAGTKPSVNSLRIDQFEELGVVAIVHMNPNEHRPWGVERLLQCRDDVLRRTN
jgi:hypothetical protein